MSETFYNILIYYFGFSSILIIVLIILFRIIDYFWCNYVKSAVKWHTGPDVWAVVTGSTDGIGLEFGRQLAQKGYNLLLLSRSLQKLNSVKNEIESQYKVKVRVLDVDFSRYDIYDRIKEELKKFNEIYVLVNNVGIMSPNDVPMNFTEYSEQFVTAIINVNIMAATRLTAMILPGMESKGRGIIINVSSISGYQPVPMLSLYSASKAYLDNMSRALSEEYKSKGVIIQSLIPGLIKTKMSLSLNKSLVRDPGQPFPDEYVRSAMKYVGKYDRTTGHSRYQYTSYLLLYVLDLISKILDINLSTKITHFVTFDLKNKLEKS